MGLWSYEIRSIQKSIVSYLKREKIYMGTQRQQISIGLNVEIVQKHHQRSGILTAGMVKDILTRASTHPHGIKVRLESGEVGRVKKIIAEHRSAMDQERF